MNYVATFARFAEHLNNLCADLDKAVAYAAEKKFDPAVLLNARLAPDQFNLMRQIQVACDNAKNGAGRLADRTAFFLMGECVSVSPTEALFTGDADPRARDYVEGRFG